MTRFRVLVDWDDDGVFSPLDEDVTADVLALSWRLGAVEHGQAVAPPGEAEVTLRSRDRRYSPELAIEALTPGRPLRIVRDQGEDVIVHFSGQISAVAVEPGGYSSRTVRLTARTVDAQLTGYQAHLPPLPETDAGAALALLLDDLPLRRNGLRDLWVMGVTANSALDSTTILAGAESSQRSFENGLTALRYPGVLWNERVMAADAVRQLVETERGRFFADRLGRLCFLNRHAALRRVDPAATFSETMDALEYAYGADVISRVCVTITPRATGTAGSVLWTLAAPQRLMPGDHLLTVHFSSATQMLGALALADVIVSANSEADGSGSAQTVSAIVRRLDGASAQIEFRNQTGAPLWLLPGTQITGTPISPLPRLMLEERDLTAATFFGGGTLSLDLPLLESVDEGEQTARFELARRARPQGTARSVRFSRFRAPAALDVTLFDRVRLIDSQTGHDQVYLVIGEAHDLAQGGAQHAITLILEPADPQVFWCIGASALETESALAY